MYVVDGKFENREESFLLLNKSSDKPIDGSGINVKTEKGNYRDNYNGIGTENHFFEVSSVRCRGEYNMVILKSVSGRVDMYKIKNVENVIITFSHYKGIWSFIYKDGSNVVNTYRINSSSFNMSKLGDFLLSHNFITITKGIKLIKVKHVIFKK